MEGNDLGGWYTKRQVVVMEPLLAEPPEGMRLLGGRVLGRKRDIADRYEINKEMCTWISHMGRQYSMPTEVWSFLPTEMFDIIQPKIDRLCGDYIVEWNNWATVGEAYHALRANPDYVVVYDADEDRVERYWHFRGVRCLRGTYPKGLFY